MINRPLILRGAFLGLVLIMATALFCEDGTGSICGKVLRSNGKPAKNAVIELIDINNGADSQQGFRWTKTDKKGQFCFNSILPCKYLIVTDYQRFDYFYCAYQPIVVSPGQDQSIELKLDLCSFLEIAGRPIIDPRRTSMSTTIEQEQLQNIPNGSSGGR